MSDCNRAVAMENQHALRESVCIRTRVPLDPVAQLDLVFGLQFKMAGGWHTRVCACSLTKRVIKVPDK